MEHDPIQESKKQFFGRIAEYDSNKFYFYRSRYTHLIIIVILVTVNLTILRGLIFNIPYLFVYLLFLKMLRKQKMLQNEKKELHAQLNLKREIFTPEEFMNLKKSIARAGRNLQIQDPS